MKPHDVVFDPKLLRLYMIVRIYEDGKAQLVSHKGYIECPLDEFVVVEDPAIQRAFEAIFSPFYKEWER